MNMNYGCMLHETGYYDWYNNQFQTIGITYSDPCAPPTSLTVPSSSTGTHTVSWGASTTSGVTYVLEESTSSSFTSFTTAYSGTALTTSSALKAAIRNYVLQLVANAAQDQTAASADLANALLAPLTAYTPATAGKAAAVAVAPSTTTTPAEP